MSAEKTLKFQFGLDETSFNRVKRALDEILAKGKEIAKVLGGVQAPGAGPSMGLLSGGSVGRAGQGAQTGGGQQTGMTRLLNDNAAAFKNMANLGSSSFKGLTDVLRNNIRNQEQELTRLQGALDKLGRTYDRLGGQGQKAQAVQQAMVRVAGRITSGQEQAAGMRDMLGQATGGAAIPPPPAWGVGPSGVEPPGPPGPGRLGRFANWFFGRTGAAGGGMGGAGGGGGGIPGMPGVPGGGAIMQAVRSPAGMVAAGASIGYGVTQLFQKGNNLTLDVNAQRGQAVQPAWQAIRRGDYSQIAAMHFIARQSPEARQRILQSIGSTEADFSDVVKGFKDLAGGDLTGMTAAGMETAKYNRMQETLQKVQATMAFQTTFGRGMEYVDQTRSDRMMLSRAGMGGFHRDPQTGEWNIAGTSRLLQNLEASGYTAGEWVGAGQQARQLGFGRRELGGVQSRIMGAGGAGFGQVADVLGAAARGGGFGNAMALTRGALGGGIQTAAGLQLGQSLFGFDPRGTVSGGGALAAIQGGMGFTGGIEDMNQVARAQLGMQGLDRLAGGFDPYQQGRNIVSAIGAMPGGTTYQQDVLGGKMGMKELLEVASGRGGGPMARAFGIGQQEATAQIGGMTSGLFGRFVEQGGDDPVSRAMRAMRESGMSETDFMAQLGKEARGKGRGAKEAKSQLEALGAYAAFEMGGDVEGGVGMVEILSGVKGLAGRKLKEGATPYGGVDELERKQREQHVIEMKKQQEALEKNIHAIAEAIGSLGGAEEKTAGFGMLKGSVETLVTDFANLSEATKKLIGSMGGSTTGQAFGRALGGSNTTKAAAPGTPAATEAENPGQGPGRPEGTY